MKEELIAETEEFVPEKRTNDQGSIVFKMVHIVAIGLPVLVIWLAQPGSSKLYQEICQLLTLWKSTLHCFHRFDSVYNSLGFINVRDQGV